MAHPGRPTVEIILSAEERATLQRWALRHKSSQALALRSKIVLACVDGGLHKDIAGRLGCSPVTVGKWRARFAGIRLHGSVASPRPRAGRPTAEDAIEKIL